MWHLIHVYKCNQYIYIILTYGHETKHHSLSLILACQTVKCLLHMLIMLSCQYSVCGMTAYMFQIHFMKILFSCCKARQFSFSSTITYNSVCVCVKWCSNYGHNHTYTRQSYGHWDAVIWLDVQLLMQQPCHQLMHANSYLFDSIII